MYPSLRGHFGYEKTCKKQWFGDLNPPKSVTQETYTKNPEDYANQWKVRNEFNKGRTMFLSRKKARQLVKSSNHKPRQGTPRGIRWYYFLWFCCFMPGCQSCFMPGCQRDSFISFPRFWAKWFKQTTLSLYPRVHLIGFERGKRRVLVADSGCRGLGGIGATR